MARVRHVVTAVSVVFCVVVVIMRFRHHLNRVTDTLMGLEEFLERQQTGHDQRDFADQQRLGGQQGDETERHRHKDSDGHHAGHHDGLLD